MPNNRKLTKMLNCPSLCKPTCHPQFRLGLKEDKDNPGRDRALSGYNNTLSRLDNNILSHVRTLASAGRRWARAKSPPLAVETVRCWRCLSVLCFTLSECFGAVRPSDVDGMCLEQEWQLESDTWGWVMSPRYICPAPCHTRTGAAGYRPGTVSVAGRGHSTRCLLLPVFFLQESGRRGAPPA